MNHFTPTNDDVLFTPRKPLSPAECLYWIGRFAEEAQESAHESDDDLTELVMPEVGR